MNIIEGDFSTPKGRFAICVARFNAFITEELVKGAVDSLVRHSHEDDALLREHLHPHTSPWNPLLHLYGDVFGQIAIIATVSALICFALSPWLRKWMHAGIAEN